MSLWMAPLPRLQEPPGVITRAQHQKDKNQRLVAQRHHCHQTFFAMSQTRQSRPLLFTMCTAIFLAVTTLPVHVPVDAHQETLGCGDWFPDDLAFLNSLLNVSWTELLALEYGVQQSADAFVRET